MREDVSIVRLPDYVHDDSFLNVPECSLRFLEVTFFRQTKICIISYLVSKNIFHLLFCLNCELTTLRTAELF